MIADNIPKGMEMPIFMHEFGVHTGMERLLGFDNMKELANEIEALGDSSRCGG
jgi:hypothetical protein